MNYLENRNPDPKPFTWTKSAGEILDKVTRAKQASESQHWRASRRGGDQASATYLRGMLCLTAIAISAIRA